MKYIVLFLLLFSSFLHASDRVEGELLVQIKQSSTLQKSARLHKSNATKIIIEGLASQYSASVKQVLKRQPKKRALTSSLVEILKIKDIPEKEIEALKKELLQVAGVQNVEPNYIFKTHQIDASSNPKISDQWYLDAIGVQDGWNQLDATETSKLADVVVAVLDSGVDYNHEDLSAAMWVNPGEIAGNNIGIANLV